MDMSIFEDKTKVPTLDELKKALGEKHTLWEQIRTYLLNLYPEAKEEWNFPGKKYGCNFRMKDKKRAILYFLPRDGFFKIAFVFGQKAYKHIMESTVAENIKKDLSEARVYVEGRGVQIVVNDSKIFPDIHQLIEIKLAH